MNKLIILGATTLFIVGIFGLVNLISFNNNEIPIQKEKIENINVVPKIPLYYNIDDKNTIYILENEEFKEVEILR